MDTDKQTTKNGSCRNEIPGYTLKDQIIRNTRARN
jgi:hypothetical protein